MLLMLWEGFSIFECKPLTGAHSSVLSSSISAITVSLCLLPLVALLGCISDGEALFLQRRHLQSPMHFPPFLMQGQWLLEHLLVLQVQNILFFELLALRKLDPVTFFLNAFSFLAMIASRTFLSSSSFEATF